VMMSAPLLIIRADADSRIGTGHVMRCLALAQGWQQHGGKVIFAGKITSVALQQKIMENGCTLVNVKQPFPALDDFELLRKLIQKNGPAACRWVVIDGYHFTADYAQCLRQAGAKILLIDDYAHQAEYSADLLLNQNSGSEGLVYKLNPDAVMLLGNKYVLLRREFLKEQNRKNKDVFPEKARHVLVTLGGADSENVTLKVIEALNLLELPQLEVKIIVGPANPYFDLLKDRMANVPFKGELVTDIKDMAPLMKWADVAITAGGSTCWELACLGVPALLIVLADNQLGVVREIANAGAGLNCGWAHKLQTDKLAARIHQLLADVNQQRLMANAGRKLVDGQGCIRVVEKMRYFPFSFRTINSDDCQLIFDWANDPVIRKASFCGGKIGWEEHKQWFRNKLDEKKLLFWIVSIHDEQLAGQVRFELSDDAGVISVSLSKEFRHKGLGSKLIRQACQKFFDVQGKTRVKACIKKDNEQSIKAFGRNGFKVAAEEVMHGYPAVVMSF
ncbi:MAG: UDP-2,4-diacetamido-2,4,6-trideoxy-beta-L-altropyranose hydrolase, partial [Desulfobulbaceae bacterium]|nr:UDP-2,4-diacetamido-2,4,6-trideoxy-beta-L-altropyranose hydrolase [Desulfobulbaceae bacterium]